MNNRAQMRMSRRGHGAPSSTVVRPQATAAAPPRAHSRVRDVVSGHVPTIPMPETIPVAPAMPPIPRTHLQSSDAARDPVVAQIAAGFSGLQDSMDRLTGAIRQANGLDEADQELDELRQINAALQAQVAHLSTENQELMAALGASVPPVAHLATETPVDPDPPVPESA